MQKGKSKVSETSEVIWNEKANQVELWVKAHKRLPKRSRTVSTEENRLGRWLEDNERSITKNTGHNLVTPARTKRIASIKKLTEPKKKYYYPHKQKPRVHMLNFEERWNLSAHALAAFQEENGRNPQRLSGDIEEDKLAAWRGGQKKASQERQAKLDKIAPGWRGITRNRRINTTDDWKVVANQYLAFFQEHQHAPRTPTAHRESLADEQRLYFWMNSQRFLLDKGKLADERKEYLDEKIPGWFTAFTRNESKWEVQFAFVKTFYTEHGRFPTPDRDKNDPRAKKAGVWMSRHRAMFKEYDSLSEKEKGRLDRLRVYLVSLSKG
jgi:hypothetical protein